MKKLCLGVMFVLLLFLSYLFFYNIHGAGNTGSKEVMKVMTDVSSTKDWQDMASLYMNKRNEMMNEILDGKQKSIKRCISILKSFECSPLLDADAALFDYMLKNTGQFTKRSSNINVEYSDIRQLTKQEVIMIAKISFRENGITRKYDYEIIFRNSGNKWLMAGLSYAE